MRTWLVQKAYCRDIERWQGKGWEPTRNATGAVVAHDTPTGGQLWLYKNDLGDMPPRLASSE